MKNFYSYRCSFNSLEIGINDLIKASGNFDGKPDKLILETVAKVLKLAPESTNIKAAIQISPIEIKNGKLVANSIELSPGRKITSYLRNAEYGALFIATVGDGLEKMGQNELLHGDLLKGYYLDLLGSLTVEKLMDKFQNEFAAELKNEGLQITNRYSPGYCEWLVSDQQQLFELIKQNRCGVRLNDSALMQPMKSISGIIGIGKQVKFQKHSCDICNNENCVYRFVRSKEL